mmetsp:Transcript_1889/g.5518  ORF Transcript_1889/g.5518 Transcript_1889/m.5518 type:complete len:345 (+) Transcript_1889:243-1277(+)
MDLISSSMKGCFGSVSSQLKLWIPELVAEEVNLDGRSFHIIKLIAEGGYSFVYLVKEGGSRGAGVNGTGGEYALKKVIAVSQETVDAAKFEIRVMAQLRHPNLLPLLASAITWEAGGARQQVAYMLFPLYPGGSVVDLVEQLAAQQQSLPASDVVNIFVQVARGLQAMHQLPSQPLIHRDVKPHNVLLRARGVAGGQPRRQGRFQAVLMDFGSCQEGRAHVSNRSQALAVQEAAERLCTAPYRAPELFDVPSECTITENVDVWSLGCLLYYMMYQASPFEHVLGATGGSLMLAVLAGVDALQWPSRNEYPEQLRQLIKYCLVSDPLKRPYIDDVIHFATTGERQ